MKTICISQIEDGTFTVYEEKPEAMEPMPGMEPAPAMGMPAEPMSEEDESKAGQPAATIDEAFEIARTMLESDGSSPEEQMMKGYNKGAPAAKPTPAKVFGE